MKRTRLTCLLGLLLGAAVPCLSRKLPELLKYLANTTTFLLSENVTIFPAQGPTIMVPSMSYNLVTGLLLACGIEPESSTCADVYTTQWILPGGGRVDSNSVGRFFVVEGPFMHPNGSFLLCSTRLSIMELSYLDAGTYTCEGRSTASGASTQWASASVELQLNCEFKFIIQDYSDTNSSLICNVQCSGTVI